MKNRASNLLRWMDRYGGILPIFFLGLLRRKKRKNYRNFRWKKDSINKILFIKTGALGDVILLSAIASELKRVLKEDHFSVHITLLCTPSNAAAGELVADIDEVLIFDIKKFFSSTRRLKQRSRNIHYDVLFDFAAWPKLNSFLTHCCKAQLKLGFRRANMHRHYVYDKYVHHRDTVHELENYRRLLNLIFVPFLSTSSRRALAIGANPKINLDAKTIRAGQKHFNRLGIKKNYVVLHMFPAGRNKKNKEWPLEYWQDVALFVLANDYSVYLTGAKSNCVEADIFMQLIESIIKKRLPLRKLADDVEIKSLAGKCSLSETAYLLARMSVGQEVRSHEEALSQASCRALVSINTGVMHLGAALGCKVVSLSGPTSVSRWGALSCSSQKKFSDDNQQTIFNLYSDYPCTPCLSLGFECQCIDNASMKRISAKEVIQILKKIL